MASYAAANPPGGRATFALSRDGAVLAAAEEGEDAQAGEEARAERLIEEQAARQGAPAGEIPYALARASALNPDVCAWLWVPGTNVSLAVARSEVSDDYYMTHNAQGEESALGSAYVQRVNSPDFSDRVTAIYGHTFTDVDLLFTGLHDLDGTLAFREHDTFYVYLRDRVLTYRIASTFTTGSKHLLGGLDLGDEKAVDAYVEHALNPRTVSTRARDVQLPEGDEARIVELSTCTLPLNDRARFITVGLLVDERPLTLLDYLPGSSPTPAP